MNKTPTKILFENGINIMKLNDDFNDGILQSMQEFSNQESKIVSLKFLEFAIKKGIQPDICFHMNDEELYDYFIENIYNKN